MVLRFELSNLLESGTSSSRRASGALTLARRFNAGSMVIKITGVASATIE
jgi:hypothetical protein